MGRIHRYGQKYEVYIWNLIARDTREGQILQRLFEKLDKMREALGSDRVFDIIDQVFPGTRLDTLIREAIFNQRRMEEIEQTIDNVDVTSLQKTMDEAFLTGLATRHIDYTGLRRETLEAEENRLVPEYVADYFIRAYRRLGGRIEKRDGLYRVPDVPYDVRRWDKDLNFKSLYGKLFRDYRKVTFDKAYARNHPDTSFVAPGHPLLEAINETVLQDFAITTNTYAVFGDPEGQREGLFWFVQGTVVDGGGTAAGKRVFCLYQAMDGSIHPVNPAVLWDLEPLDAEVIDNKAGIMNLLENRDAVEDHIITDILLPYQGEIAIRREREAEVKEKYGLRSLDYLMQESNQKILDYQLRQQMGEEMDLPLLQEQRNLEQLQERRSALEREIRVERNLTIDAPRILGAAVVLPLQPELTEDGYVYPGTTSEGQPENFTSEGNDAGAYGIGGMHRDDEAEATGMAVAMAFEREQGRHPDDVSSENLGFDVRSIAYNADGTLYGARYIEVKARAQSGAVRISANEWKKARHFGENFWLYIVTGAKTESPKLHRIQDPADQFRLGDDIEVTGYIIKEDAWRHKVVGNLSI